MTPHPAMADLLREEYERGYSEAMLPVADLARKAAAAERHRLRATMERWDGPDWDLMPKNQRIVNLLAHHEDDWPSEARIAAALEQGE